MNLDRIQLEGKSTEVVYYSLLLRIVVSRLRALSQITLKSAYEIKELRQERDILTERLVGAILKAQGSSSHDENMDGLYIANGIPLRINGQQRLCSIRN